ncbi:BPSS1780 family membrane protein [Pseudoxanthomonas suwonensis]|uniref:Membrane protein n=1 Tax=Pseudoxanthomonas suwonensis TaxID=314722 RepID=A0A0E3UPR8_9GAMM|nr:BPSS1780 family membrane protein [Pseudoxanthomonas suwonensis]AKC88296.1 membrane protein [Pseudoxanthomonas suwonensis]
MDTIRKLPASDGAEWLLGGFALLRRAPLALGALGALWGLLASLVMAVGMAVPALAAVLQFLVALAGPVLFAGLVWAVREVAHGRPALPVHLLQGVREGRVPQLLTTLLPQVAAGLVLGVLLLVLVGTQQLQHLAQASEELNALAQSGQQPTPEQVEALVAGLPAGRILLWLLLGLAAAVAVAMTVFVSVPRILFDRRGGLEAMRDSLRACLHNLPALAVFLLLTLVAVFAVYFGVLLATLVLQLLAGPLLAMWIAQLLLMGVLMPLLAGATYTAWTRFFGEAVPEVAAAPAQIEV